MTRIAVFASGRGSNFRALAEAEQAGVLPARIVLLLCDQPAAGALAIASEFGIEALVIAPESRRARLSADTEERFVAACRQAAVEWICLAGFMRILGPVLLDSYADRVLNIHPSLLPSFPGLDAQRQAWEHGVRVSGCTVHMVDSSVDTGPIVLQQAVAALPEDGPEDLAARILQEEHRLYPAALRMMLAGNWERRGRRIIFTQREGKNP